MDMRVFLINLDESYIETKRCVSERCVWRCTDDGTQSSYYISIR